MDGAHFGDLEQSFPLRRAQIARDAGLRSVWRTCDGGKSPQSLAVRLDLRVREMDLDALQIEVLALRVHASESCLFAAPVRTLMIPVAFIRCSAPLHVYRYIWYCAYLRIRAARGRLRGLREGPSDAPHGNVRQEVPAPTKRNGVDVVAFAFHTGYSPPPNGIERAGRPSTIAQNVREHGVPLEREGPDPTFVGFLRT